MSDTDWFARDLEELLSQTCDVESFTSLGNDALGNLLKSWTPSSSDVSCLLEVVRTEEPDREFVIENAVTFADFRLYLDPTADVAEKDRITNLDGDTEIYEILYVEPMKDLDASTGHREVLVRIVR
jgi:hypothetical protein